MSEQTVEIRRHLRTLADRFDAIKDEWEVFYGHHFRNGGNKAEAVDNAYGDLRQSFEEIEQLETGEDPESSPQSADHEM